MAIKVDGVLVAGGAGSPGKSAYQTAKEAGYAGTEAEFANSLVNASSPPTSLLASGTIAAGASSVTLDLSAVDLTQFRELWLYMYDVTDATWMSNGYRWVSLRFNRDAVGSNYYSHTNDRPTSQTGIHTAQFSSSNSTNKKMARFDGQYRIIPVDFANIIIVDTPYAYSKYDIADSVGIFLAYEDQQTNVQDYSYWKQGSFSVVNSITILLAGWSESSSSTIVNYSFGNTATYRLYGLRK